LSGNVINETITAQPGFSGYRALNHDQMKSSPDKRVPRARRLRREMTDAERKLWGRLRHLELPDTHFRRQATIGPYFADFACHAQRLVVEVDGSQHAEAANMLRDEERSAYLRSGGYRVLRFWNNDVLQRIESVMEAIYSALREPGG
jgi:very-short-patch-repair endonuclease